MYKMKAEKVHKEKTARTIQQKQDDSGILQFVDEDGDDDTLRTSYTRLTLPENHNWILFFGEVNTLFDKRTLTNTSNSYHTNQEVAYFLQWIKDFLGTIILVINLRSNTDEAFSRRFQSIIYFPMPTEELHAELWRKMLPGKWLGKDANRY